MQEKLRRTRSYLEKNPQNAAQPSFHYPGLAQLL